MFTPPDRFLRVARPDGDGRVRIGPRQIYILPTRYGLGFGLLLVLMLAGSINYANNLGFLLTFLLAGLGVVAMLHTWRNLNGIEILPGRNEPVFAGDRARFALRLRHPGGEHPGIGLGLGRETALLLDLPATGEADAGLTLPVERRGLQPLPRLRIHTTWPLGLLRAWAFVETDHRVLVYPRPGPPTPPREAADYRPSARGDKGVGADDFVALRHYRPGDSPRHIHWKSLAREQGLQTKQFGGDRAERLWLEWALTPGDTETRLSLLCRAVIEASDQGLAFGLRLPDGEIPPALGQAQRRRCLERLALFGGTE